MKSTNKRSTTAFATADTKAQSAQSWRGRKLKLAAAVVSLSLVVAFATALGASAFAVENQQASTAADEVVNQLIAQLASGESAGGGQSVFDYPEEQASVEDVSLPSKFDLRDGGNVTSVKYQAPWGTCWAFGIIASVETSILSESGQAATDKDGKDTLDLSERHLAWFAKNHIAAEGEEEYQGSVDNQAGEGVWWINGTSSSSMSSGMPFYGTSVFSAGMGTVVESYTDRQGQKVEFAPYRGANSIISAKKNGKMVDYDSLEAAIADGATPRYYSASDDWSLPEAKRFYQSYALEESNFLPSVTPIVNQDSSVSLNEDGITAMKQELLAGRGIAFCYTADTSSPSDEASASTSRFINTSTWAQYTWSSSSKTWSGSDHPNHCVCIVGWDDDYDASNFTLSQAPAKWDSNQYPIYKLTGAQLENDEEGNPFYLNSDGETVFLSKTSQLIEATELVDDYEHTIYKLKETELENTSGGNPINPDTGEALKDMSVLTEVAREDLDVSVTTPPGNGAWICKNSWGSDSNEFPNKLDWGNDGYFYLSYYDLSICGMETFDFLVGDSETSAYDYTLVYGYDYMPSSEVKVATFAQPVSMANVFSNDDQVVEVDSLSCETAKPNSTVQLKVYLLNEDAEGPTDGELATTVTATYEYGGYHRAVLSEPVVVAKGQSFSVVETQSYQQGGETIYVINMNLANNEAYAEAYGVGYYTKGIINEGESMILGYDENSTSWRDWKEVSEELKVLGALQKADTDNFNIKAYAKPVDLDVTASYTSFAEGKASADLVLIIGKEMSGFCAANFDDSADGGLWCDDAQVASKNYTVEDGSIKLTLKAAYLNTLAAGDHTLRVYLKDSETCTLQPAYVDVALTVTKAGVPATGDWLARLLAKL